MRQRNLRLNIRHENTNRTGKRTANNATSYTQSLDSNFLAKVAANLIGNRSDGRSLSAYSALF